MLEKNRDTVRKVSDCFVKNDYEGFLDYCTEDVQWTVVGNKTVRGKEATRQWMKSMEEEGNFEPPNFTVLEPIIAEGDFVITRGDMSMKEKNGKEGNYSYCDIYRFRDDKISELNSFVIKIEPKAESRTEIK